ncbi:streptogrisin C [Herbihabitans rhizosphaerae]|uniref:Streptogrisin C n=1 Tax=Herbihabitans rhizosphaerae TaxID=1872711 RepID=A0A4Q7KEX8_9PSEU|nr:proprotein convertase P-domain-containing protein [Herbihabitans rhizosphaerae]RZS32651.1 streptogrisin C [Herbihabitans rhizosphaerae]
MLLRRKVMAAVCGSVLATGTFAASAAAASPDASAARAPEATVRGVASAFGVSEEVARTQLRQQDEAHRVLDSMPAALRAQLAGHWFDPATGKLTVAVTSEGARQQASAAGAETKIVVRGKAELDRLLGEVRALVGDGVPGVYGWGVDVRANAVRVAVNRSVRAAATDEFTTRASAYGEGVRVVETDSQPRRQSNEQAGTIQTGNPWWPGGESNCSVGFSVTDAQGGKAFLTAGHCTNNADQPAYGQSGQQNKIGTSNPGNKYFYNGREGDMGLVTVTEPGWTLSAEVNTWNNPAITVSGSAEAMVGDRVCHSGNTSKWQCGEVKYTHKAVDYGGGLIIEDMTWTTACSLGGDSGGGWLLGDKATGLHDGGPSQCVPNPSDDELSIFQPVNEPLALWNLKLVTGGGSDDAQAPTAPGNPRSTGSTATSVSLAWDASTDNVGVTEYQVFNGSTLATTVAGTSATVTALTADTEHTFTVKAKDAAGNVSAASAPVTARTRPGDSARTFTNGTDHPIRDFRVAISQIGSTAADSVSDPITVAVSATHTCYEDLNITLVSPSGRAYALARTPGGYYDCTAFPQGKTYTVAPAVERAAGTWTLRIGDNGPGDTGTLDRWSITV